MGKIDLLGNVYGKLTVIETSSFNYRGYCLCKCSCGNIKKILSSSLQSGRTKSCGCINKERLIKERTKHGMMSGNKRYHPHLLYGVWVAIRNRCNNPKQKQYKDYGGRGIKICDEWNDFINFFNWAINNGWEKGLTIERKDNNHGYNPNNCCFVSRVINNNNKRSNHNITYNNRTQSLSNWARELNMSPKKLSSRILKYKWNVEKAFNISINN